MRLAIIDLGTNSIRFDIHEVFANRVGGLKHRRLYREKTMVRLGQDLFLNGKLSPDAKRRTLKSILSFKDTLDALHVDRVLAFGTAATRDAVDGRDFLESIKVETGIEFKILRGEEEASLIANGILSHEKLPSKGAYALIDIGGGSTEVSICKGNKVLHSTSFNLGVAKLEQLFSKSKNQVKDLRHHIKSTVLPKIIIERWPKTDLLIGSSGSIIALAKLAHQDLDKGKDPFTKKQLSQVVKRIQGKTPSELLSLPGMEQKRIDLILSGAVLLEELLIMLKAKKIRTTEFSLRDGILIQELSRFHQSKKRGASFSLSEVEKRAEKWGIDLTHASQVKKHAEFLFEELKSIHKLKSEWKPFLLAASVLHDVGETISHSKHSEHSAYMVKNANIIGMPEWEAEFIASLCRYHQEEKIFEKKNEKKIPYPKKHELRSPYLKLLSLLQLADALDRSHKSALKLLRAIKSKHSVTLSFKSVEPCDLEILRVDQKKGLFEHLFKRTLEMKRKR